MESAALQKSPNHRLQTQRGTQSCSLLGWSLKSKAPRNAERAQRALVPAQTPPVIQRALCNNTFIDMCNVDCGAFGTLRMD